MIYENGRTFKIIDFVCSHSQLLLRSFGTNGDPFNIDLLFKGVSFLQLPTSLDGISIGLLDSLANEEKDSYPFGTDRNNGNVVYVLRSGEELSFLNALGFSIYHNQLELLESSIGRYDWGDMNEHVLSHNLD